MISSIIFLLVCASPWNVKGQIDPNVAPKCYSDKELSIPHSLKGSWTKYVGNLKPVQLHCRSTKKSERSCSTTNRRNFAEAKVFTPDSCLLPDFNERIFEEALQGRLLYFVGDSVIMQQKTRLKCDMSNSTFIRSLRVSHEVHFNAQLARLGKIPADSIVLFNVGLHYNSKKLYARFLQNFEHTCLKKSCTNATIVWQETAAQHFPGSPNGYFQVRSVCKTGCAPSKRNVLLSGDFRNEMANKIMKEYQIPVLRVWEITQGAHDMHIQFQSKLGLCDCTHFCNIPWGVFRAYNRVLQGWLVQNTL